MRSSSLAVLPCVLIALLLLAPAPISASSTSMDSMGAEAVSPRDDQAVVSISGTVLDFHQEPVAGSVVEIYLDGNLVRELETGETGNYVADIPVDKARLGEATVAVKIEKPNFEEKTFRVQASELAQQGGQLFLSRDVTLARVVGPAFWIAAVVFVLAYILIAFELLHRTIAAMLGASIMLLISYTLGTLSHDYFILSFERAISAIDMNVIFLLMGMMIIVGVLKHTGVFQWCAYMAYKLSRGRFFLMAAYLMIFTAVTSAFLDNVTTMLLLTGVAIEICVALSINPLYLLIPLILASNVGGTATLIGDPPNILIGSYSGLSFLEFVMALGPISLVCLIALLVFSKLVWGREYAKTRVDDVDAFIKKLQRKHRITDSTLLTYGLAVLGFVVFLFLTESYWHMEVSVAAMLGGAVLVTIGVLTDKVNLIELIEKDIEWPTLMFFMFLFMLVGAVEATGLLSLIADWILHISQGDFVLACTFILWVAAIMSAFVDNIPFTATMLPVVAYLSNVIPEAHNTLWWALALGACYGGNGTIIGASANVVTVGIAESRGYRTTFGGFMKTAFPFMILTVIVAQAWLLLFPPS